MKIGKNQTSEFKPDIPSSLAFILIKIQSLIFDQLAKTCFLTYTEKPMSWFQPKVCFNKGLLVDN